MIAGVETEDGSCDLDCPRPFLEVVCHPVLGLDVVYLCAVVSRSRDITGGPQNLKWVTRPWPHHL